MTQSEKDAEGVTTQRKIVSAPQGWWHYMLDRGYENAQEIIAFYVEPVIDEFDCVGDFITLPVTVYGSFDHNYGLMLSPSGRWYSSLLTGSFGSKAEILARLQELESVRARGANE